jgi:hypothetical protein
VEVGATSNNVAINIPFNDTSSALVPSVLSPRYLGYSLKGFDGQVGGFSNTKVIQGEGSIKRNKCAQARSKKPTMVVGHDVMIEYILKFLEKSLIGHFSGKVVHMDSLYQQMELNWVPGLGYFLIFHFFLCGWLCFISNS